jgi:protease-4
MPDRASARRRAARARAALARGSFALRALLWRVGELVRRLRRAPDYATFLLEGEYPDLRPPRRDFIRRRLLRAGTSLQDLAERFRAVAGDPRIRGVVLHLRALRISFAQLETLRGLILELRDAGKEVVAWSTSYDRAGYALACAADRVAIQPGGWIPPLGVRTQRVYLADTLKRFGVKADFTPIAPYKTAGDVLTRSAASDEDREMTNWLMDSLFGELVRGIAAGRGLDEPGARALIDASPYVDLRARETGAIDSIVCEEELPALLGSAARPASLAPWEEVRLSVRRPPPARASDHVALLRIDGEIIDGRSQNPPVEPPVPVPLVWGDRAGDLTLVQLARRVREDPRAAAAVVYVNSRGGSGSASEAIAAALAQLGETKPVVVAMGSVAGSGGYYVAAPARWIVAQPSTLTGSIGVILGKIVLGDLLDKLLVGRESVARGRHMGMEDPDRRFDPEERRALRARMERVYERFIERVAEGRGLSRDAVTAVAGGRVFTGRQALERGLVDELGGLDRALAKARELGGLAPDAPALEYAPPRQRLAPGLSPAASLVGYAVEGIEAWNAAGVLCLSPALGPEVC